MFKNLALDRGFSIGSPSGNPIREMGGGVGGTLTGAQLLRVLLGKAIRLFRLILPPYCRHCVRLDSIINTNHGTLGTLS